MSKQVTLIDYGASNLLNVQHAFEHVGAQVSIAQTAAQIDKADRIVFPGVGSYPDAIAQLTEKELVTAIQSAAASKPFLGICLGMQMMLTNSEEFGLTSGLNLLSGSAVELPRTSLGGEAINIPHIGWKTLRQSNHQQLLSGIDEDESFYFVHSYHAQLDDKTQIAATMDVAGHQITAMISHENMVGCQFHPEKSGQAGLQLIKNFLAL